MAAYESPRLRRLRSDLAALDRLREESSVFAFRGNGKPPQQYYITFLDQTGAKSVKAEIAFSVPVSRILPNIITKMNLPTTSPDGQPMSYSLDHKEGGRRLVESSTLVEAGVQNGDHLIVYPEVVAGRA